MMIEMLKPHSMFAAGVPDLTFRDNEIVQNTNGSFTVKGIKMFRAGTFRDSMGDQHTWSIGDLEAMVTNYNLLKDAGKLVDVPVRRDHSYSVDKVIGYFEKLYVEDVFLMVDINVGLEEDLHKLAVGIYRNVSAEIGVYSDNGDEMYFPVVMGVAYVDIPAVEGLYSNSIKDGNGVGHLDAVYTNQTSNTGTWTTQKLEISPNAGERINQWVTSQPEITYYTRVAQENTVTTENEKYTFNIGGEQTSDFGKVQAYVAQLEAKNTELAAKVDEHVQFTKELGEVMRADFVAQLAKDGKIAAAQVTGLSDATKSMDDAQFESFKAAYKDAPVLRQFSEHGGTGTGTEDRKTEKDDQLSIYRQRVATLRRSGMPDEKIAKTESFQKLTELEAAAS